MFSVPLETRCLAPFQRRVTAVRASLRPASPSRLRRRELKRNPRRLLGMDSDMLRPRREYAACLSAHVVLSRLEAHKLEMAVAVGAREIRMVSIGGLHRNRGVVHRFAMRVEHSAREC